jgi:hypothetical protein
MTTYKEAFLNIQSDEKWVLHVQDKIRQNDIKNLNLSCKKIHTKVFKTSLQEKNLPNTFVC